MVKVRGNQTGATIERPLVLGELRPVEFSRGRHRDAIAVNPGVEPVGGRAAGGAEEVVEAAVQRAVRDRSRVIDPPHGFETVLVDRLPLLVKERQPDVPLAEHRRFVADLPQHRRKCEPIVRDQAGSARAGEDAAVVESERHPPGEQAVPCRRADRRGAVGVGEPHPLLGQPVDMRRRDLRLRVVAADVPVAEIVGEDQQDVGPL